MVAGAAVILSQEYSYHIYVPKDSISDLSVDCEGDFKLSIAEINPAGDETEVVLTAEKPGKGYIDIKYNLGSEGDKSFAMESAPVVVTKTGMIFVGPDAYDYGGLEVTYWGLAFFFGLMVFYFAWLRRQQKKEDYYSFRSIGYTAAIILLAVLFIIYLAADLSTLFIPHIQTAKLVVLITRNLMLAYSMFTIPFMGIFAIALAISNVELMRHEGKRPANMLGIATAVLIAAGAVVNLILFRFYEMLPVDSAALGLFYGIYSAAFAILQVLLLASMICCLQAAYRKVPYDKDYIMILGCAIRKDGTLYPLIQGRVDRAISFWEAQYKATGKRTVFVPSGGQGSDEIMPEARAMEKYLLDKGIPQEYILSEDRSTTTLENMKFSKELIKKQNENANIAFSTTNYHVFRSGILAGQAGVKADGLGARTKWYFWPNAMLREVAGVFARQSKLQWLFLICIIILAGLIGYGYSLIF